MSTLGHHNEGICGLEEARVDAGSSLRRWLQNSKLPSGNENVTERNTEDKMDNMG